MPWLQELILEKLASLLMLNIIGYEVNTSRKEMVEFGSLFPFQPDLSICGITQPVDSLADMNTNDLLQQMLYPSNSLLRGPKIMGLTSII